MNLQRYEKHKDHDGNITSIFVAVGVEKDEESMTQEHWLTEEERDAVLENEDNLTPILEKVAAEGLVRLEEWVATKPQPPEIATETKKKTFAFDKKKIDAQVVEIKEAKVEAEKISEPIIEEVIK